MAAAFSVVATLVSSVFAFALLQRWWMGVRRARAFGSMSNRALLWWGVSVAMFAGASAMLAVGALWSWSTWSFRAFYLFGAVLNVPWLAVGSVTANQRARVVQRITGGAALLVGLLFLPGALGDSAALWVPGAILGIGWGLGLVIGRGDLELLSVSLLVAFTLLALAQVPGAVLSGPLSTDVMPEGRDLFPLGVRGLAVGGNAVGAVMVIVSAAASAVNLAWSKPPRGALARARAQAERGVTDVVARWLFAGRRGVHTTVNYVRGNLLIAVGVTVAGVGGAIGGIEGHAVGLGVGVTLMFLGFTITTRPAADPG